MSDELMVQGRRLRAEDLAQVRAKIQAADCLHANETHWRVDMWPAY